MSKHTVTQWSHPHTFGLDRKGEAERRTLIVLIITLITMVVEVAAGIQFGSMALLADGLHMGSHATALGINVMAYFYARKYAYDSRFTFGTGKINALGAYTSAILLGVFALSMVWESTDRLLYPRPIIFDWAIAVAVVGLIVNAVSVLILHVKDGHGHSHSHAHDHHHEHHHAPDHVDMNLRSAYLHVMTDALTSVLAIIALLAGKYWGAAWMDPMMGFLGAVLIVRWSWSLLKQTSLRLLDYQAPPAIHEAVRKAIEAEENTEIFDLHVWLIAPGTYAAIIGIVTHHPKAPEYYKDLVPTNLGISHITVEVHECADEECRAQTA